MPYHIVIMNLHSNLVKITLLKYLIVFATIFLPLKLICAELQYEENSSKVGFNANLDFLDYQIKQLDFSVPIQPNDAEKDLSKQYLVEGSLLSLSQNSLCKYLSTTNQSCDMLNLSFSGKAHIPLNESFSFYGKLGLNYKQSQIDSDISILRLNLNDIGARYGIGLNYELKKNWFIHAESDLSYLMDINSSNFNSFDYNIDNTSYSLGISIKF